LQLAFRNDKIRKTEKVEIGRRENRKKKRGGKTKLRLSGSLLVEKLPFINTKFSAHYPLFKKFRDKIEILSTTMSSVRNLQLSVGTLQVPVPLQ